MRSETSDGAPQSGSISWRSFGQIAQRFAEATALDDIVHAIADEARSALNTGSVVLWLLEKRANALRLAASNVNPELLAPVRTLPLTAPAVATEVARTHHPVEIPDILAVGENYALTREVAKSVGVRSLYAQPLVVKGLLIGVLTLATPTPRRLTDDERAFVGAFADLSALAIENTRRVQDAEEARKHVDVILNSIADAFYALDRSWRITYLNRAAEQFFAQVFHKSARELVGQRLWSVFPEVEGSTLGRELHRAMEQNVSNTFEEYYPPAHVWIEVRLYPSRDGLSVYFRDITQRKRAQEERDRLLHHEAGIATIAAALVRDVELPSVLDTVVEQSLRTLGVDDVAVWLADAEQRTLTLHAARGFRPDFFELKKRLSYDDPYLASRAARTEQMQVIEDVSDPSVSPEARRFYQHEGLASLVAMPLCARSRLVGIIGFGSHTVHRFAWREREYLRTVADLFAVAVENAQLYGQLQATLLLREEFMSAAAHEMRTPVTVVKGRVQHILRQNTLTPQLRQALTAVLHQTDRLAHLIDDLLTVAQLRPGKVEVNHAPFDLSELIRKTVAEISRTSSSYRYRVTTPDSLVVDADHNLIREVLDRLLENARRFSPKGGPIEVTARREGRRAIVAVTDHGIGIEPERQPYVFEPFYQLIPPGQPGYVGIISLGLYLAKQIVEAHGGQIWLASTPGLGSTFTISLPLEHYAAREG